MRKEDIIQQGREYLQKNHFKEAEEIFQLLISSGENEPEILELKGDSLYRQGRDDFAQKCYNDAIEMIMSKIFDLTKSSKIDNKLKVHYEKLLKKLTESDVRLYPKYDDLISRIQKGDHPRLLTDLKHELEKRDFELNYCGDYFTKHRDHDKYQTDQLTIEIIANKSEDSSEFISSKMVEYMQNKHINIDIIIPVPNHISDDPQICKGVSIALNLATKLGKPCVTTALQKKERSSRNRKSSSLPIREELADRQYDILDNSDIINKRILLVDDVLASGATIKKCAKLLMDNCARHVDILCAGKSFYSIIS